MQRLLSAEAVQIFVLSELHETSKFVQNLPKIAFV